MALDFLPAPPPPPPDRASVSPGEGSPFAAAGFAEPDRAAREWVSLLDLLDGSERAADVARAAWDALTRAADPDLALRQTTTWLDGLRAEGADALAAAYRRLEANPHFVEAFVLTLGASEALGDVLVQRWALFAPEAWGGRWETPASMSTRLWGAVREAGGASAERLSDIPEAVYLRTLKRFQAGEEVRALYLDECMRLPVEQVTQQVSWLADVLAQACLDYAADVVARQFRTVAPRDGFTIFGLGKLGGLELNYSSDIDLIFIVDEDAVRAADGATEGATIHDPTVFFTRVAERTIDLLGKHAEGPPLYRVDTRLRPEGSRGRLVWPARAALSYYDSIGRTWERMAMIRLRAIAGDLELGRRYEDALDAFVFRGLLSEEALVDLKNLKLQIESLAKKKGESGTHVKIGEGGIRDVEFIAQYLQLVYGARHPELKRANVFDLLESLARLGILRSEEADSLGTGYRLLRQIENRIQVSHRLQAHTLPESPSELRRIARGLGFASVEAFRARLRAARARVRTVYRRLFEGASSEETTDALITSLVDLPLEVAAERGVPFLEKLGFADAARALELVRRTAGESAAAWVRAEARRTFLEIAADLLREISQFPDPDRTLANFCDAVETLGARSILFELLRDSEEALAKMVEVCGHSRYLIEILRSHPGIFDEAIDALRTGHQLERDELVREALRVVDEADDVTEAVRRLGEFKHLHLLAIAFRDVERADNLMTAMGRLADLAEAVLGAVLRLALRDVTGRLGELTPAEGAEQPAFVVLGLGKLGGAEMNYRSDLDLVFLYRGEGRSASGLSAQEYYTQLAQALFALLQRPGPIGVLWESDPRLRPMGSKNLLAISFASLREYFETGTAQTWERQAFLRARPLGGDEAFGAEVERFIRERLPLAPDEDRVAFCRDVIEMRERLEASVPAGDIKRGRGGIMDVEFTVQAMQLIHGRGRPELISPNTVEGLLKLLKAGLLDELAGSELLSGYQFLRWLETRFSLLLSPGESISKLDHERLRSLIQGIGYRASGAEEAESIFLDELRYHCGRNRHHFEWVLREAPLER